MLEYVRKFANLSEDEPAPDSMIEIPQKRKKGQMGNDSEPDPAKH